MVREGSTPPPSTRLSRQVAAWDRIVRQVEGGYGFDLDTWLNDMDLRRGIDEAMHGLAAGQAADRTLADRLAAIDRRFREATVDAGKCLWGRAAAAHEGWHADRQWWYFRKPRPGNAALDREIERVT